MKSKCTLVVLSMKEQIEINGGYFSEDSIIGVAFNKIHEIYADVRDFFIGVWDGLSS